jgi:hypothetical protein
MEMVYLAITIAWNKRIPNVCRVLENSFVE